MSPRLALMALCCLRVSALQPPRSHQRVCGAAQRAAPLRSAPPGEETAPLGEEAAPAGEWAARDAPAPPIEAARDVSREIEALKTRIFSACASCDRGFGASANDRQNIEDLLEDIGAICPTDEPTRGLAGGDGTALASESAPLRKLWRLVYTSASDVSTLAANPFVAVGAIYQDARELPVIVNVIENIPRALTALTPDAQKRFATSTLLKVKTVARKRSATRVGLDFAAVQVVQRNVLGNAAPAWLPRPEVNLPQLGLGLQRRLFGVSEDEDPRDASPAYFDVVFIDENFLIIKQASPGGYFAAVAVDDDID